MATKRRSTAAAGGGDTVRKNGRRQLVGEREIDRTCPGPGWTLRAADRPLDFEGVDGMRLHYFVNSVLPAEEVIARPNFPELFRTGRVVWAEPGRRPGPTPQPLPPVNPTPKPRVIFVDDFDLVVAWHKTVEATMATAPGVPRRDAADLIRAFKDERGREVGNTLYLRAQKANYDRQVRARTGGSYFPGGPIEPLT
jgi:hypothetical protein